MPYVLRPIRKGGRPWIGKKLKMFYRVALDDPFGLPRNWTNMPAIKVTGEKSLHVVMTRLHGFKGYLGNKGISDGNSQSS